MSVVLDPPASVAAPLGLHWRNRFAALGEPFYTALGAQGLPSPHWVATSRACAERLGWPIDWWRAPGALEVFSGNGLWPGMQPLASVYSGHQFGVWAGQLGDGRALLLGEVDSPAGPQELQLKGSGLTPYSRMGDGRAVLRSSIREFLCSEAMAALGIPTTRALCITGSALPVRREEIETAAIVTRVAPSFIRFGHFEHFTHTARDFAALRRLADFVIDGWYPECRDAARPCAAMLEAAALRTAELVAQWQAVGFCHGVMNTDNLSILGLTIDYGPFGFLDAYDPGHICNHSDPQGRYAYARQPQIAYWNLHALAQALLPLLGEGEAAGEVALAALKPFESAFSRALLRRFADKLGLVEPREDDAALINDLLALMAADRADFTITFRRLAGFSSLADARNDAVRDLFIDREAFDVWGRRYAERLRSQGGGDAERAACMRRTNPHVVLRNHLAETAIGAARSGDFGEIERLLRVLERPFDDSPEHRAYADFPPDWASSLEVSCSS
jgi:uncharacterized protein YdiU (UPF0061 family)